MADTKEAAKTGEVHPIFAPMLKALGGDYDQGRLPQPFDEFDDALMRNVAGERLAKPVQDLLVLLWQIECAEASFGPADRERVYNAAVEKMKALRQACREEWADL